MKVIKDREGNILVEEEMVRARWKEYFETLLNERNEAEELIETPPVEGPVQMVTMQEVSKAIRKMMKNKAAGPSEVTIKMIKALRHPGVRWTH